MLTQRRYPFARHYSSIAPALLSIIALLGIPSSAAATPPGAMLPGEEDWIARYDSTLPTYSDNDIAVGIASSPAQVFVTGDSNGGTSGTDFATVAYSSVTGLQQWVSRFNDPINGFDHARAIAVSPDGSLVFVTGDVPSAATRSDYQTVAYNAATGAQVWATTYTRYDYEDGATSIVASPDGSKVFATGWSRSAASGVDFATVAYNAVTGEQLWVERYDGPGHGGDFGRAITVAPDSSAVFVTGESWGGNVAVAGTGNDYATVALDASTGDRLWVQRQSGPGRSEDFPTAIEISPTGNRVFITGHAYAKSNDYVTVGYNTEDGARLWSMRYHGAKSGFDGATAVGVSSDGATVVVTGNSYGSEIHRQDVATVAYASGTGVLQWVRRYDGPTTGYPDDDLGADLAINPVSNRVYVTGSTDSFDQDFATFAYAMNDGATVWSTRFDGAESGIDIGTAVAAAPDGSRVFVTGFTWGGYTTYNDYGTASYDA